MIPQKATRGETARQRAEPGDEPCGGAAQVCLRLRDGLRAEYYALLPDEPPVQRSLTFINEIEVTVTISCRTAANEIATILTRGWAGRLARQLVNRRLHTA